MGLNVSIESYLDRIGRVLVFLCLPVVIVNRNVDKVIVPVFDRRNITYSLVFLSQRGVGKWVNRMSSRLSGEGSVGHAVVLAFRLTGVKVKRGGDNVRRRKVEKLSDDSGIVRC
jgi:hypothetical protein